MAAGVGQDGALLALIGDEVRAGGLVQKEEKEEMEEGGRHTAVLRKASNDGLAR